MLCSQLPPYCCKHRDIPKSSPHRYPTHSLSHNHHLPMCICEGIGGQTPQKCSFIHTHSTCRCCYALNFRQTGASTKISGNQVHTVAAHTLCLTTTTFPCVFVKKQEVKHRKNARLYTRSRLFAALMSLNSRQTAANIVIFWNQVHAGAPHTFCLTTTTFPCVFLKK